jgi:uncharacterized membrane protein
VADSVLILVVLALNVALCEWACRRTWLRHLGTALLVIVVTAIEANLGLIPTYPTDGSSVAVYDATFEHVVALSVFWLLLDVDLRRVWRAGASMIALFLIGSAGIALGVIAGMSVVGGSGAFGEFHAPLGGMFVGTYTGGSVNFAAIATAYAVDEHAVLFAGANAVDAAMTTVWMAACVALPRVLAPFWPTRKAAGAAPAEAIAAPDEHDTLDPAGLALTLGIGGLAHFVSNQVGTRLDVPSILVLTTLALVLAQTRAPRYLRGNRVLGLFGIYIFLCVIGALCDVDAVAGIGQTAVDLTVFVAVIFAVHAVVIFGAAALLRIDPFVASVASQAGIGGGSSALALAKSLGRGDLVLPGILAGSLGTAIGTYLGFAVVWLLER